MLKKIFLIWQQEFVNLSKTADNNFWGLGDLIRGTIATIQISKKYNLDLTIDIKRHPISNFLDYKTDIEELYNYNDVLFIPNGNLENYIKTFIHDERTKLYFGTNEFCSNIISQEEKDIIKKILKPTNCFNEKININILRLPANFTIQHYRTGDYEIVKNLNVYDTDYFKILLTKIKNNYIDTDILLSDSLEFKRYVKQYFNIYLFTHDIAHTGFEINLLKLENTLLEFFIIINSKKIKTYRWNSEGMYVSGFVNWVSKIYDIPLEIIK